MPFTRSFLRKLSVGPCKHPNIDWNKMFAATRVKNFMMDDPLIDWLRFMKYKPNEKGESGRGRKFMKKTFKDGHVFEKKVMGYLEKKHQVVTIGESNQARSFRNFMKTKKAMEA